MKNKYEPSRSSRRVRVGFTNLKRLLLPVLAAAGIAACAYPAPYYAGDPGYGGASRSSSPTAPSTWSSYDPAPPQTAMLSFGAVKQYLRVGATTQEDVLKTLGPPNNMTLNSQGNEVWVYDQVHSQIETTGSGTTAGARIGFGTVGAGLGAGAMFGGSESRSKSQLVSATRTLTIILEFDSRHVLRDLAAREGRY